MSFLVLFLPHVLKSTIYHVQLILLQQFSLYAKQLPLETCAPPSLSCFVSWKGDPCGLNKRFPCSLALEEMGEQTAEELEYFLPNSLTDLVMQFQGPQQSVLLCYSSHHWTIRHHCPFCLRIKSSFPLASDYLNIPISFLNSTQTSVNRIFITFCTTVQLNLCSFCWPLDWHSFPEYLHFEKQQIQTQLEGHLKEIVFTVQINTVQVNRAQINCHQVILDLDSLRTYISVLTVKNLHFVNSPGDDRIIGNLFMPNKLIGH